MSGIFGIIDIQRRPLEPSWMTSMMKTLSHRGKDGRGYWHEAHVAIGHLLLEITPEHKSEQSPLIYHNLVVTADSRLDEREDLAKKLGISLSDPQRNISDHLLIACAYEKWGGNCTRHLLGDFAFAIWDTREQSLFCARDHAGIKPFFYCLTNDRFLFASEIKAIAQLPFAPRSLNEDLLEEYLLLAEWRGEHVAGTYFKGIKRLMPARHFFLREGRILESTYWTPRHQTTLKLPSSSDYAQALRELMIKAVHDRLRTNYPVGVTLSGGLDSSSIACIAARQLAQRDRLLFAASSVLPDDYEGPERDERQFIEAVVLQEKNIRISYVNASEYAIFENVHHSFEKAYAPVNSFHYMDDALNGSLLASEKGIRTVLDGFMGDATVSHHSNGSLAHLIRLGQLISAWQLYQKRRKMSGASCLTIAKQEVLRPLAPRFVLDILGKLKGHKSTPFIDQTAFNTEFAPKKTISKYQQLALGGGISNNVYEDIWDVNTINLPEEYSTRHTYFQLEHLYPWMDKRIIDFMFSLPPEQFLHEGWRRGLIRFAMDGILPPSVQWRKDKQLYSPDFMQRLMREVPAIRLKISNWEKDPLHYRTVSFPKIKKQLEVLESSGKAPTFDSKFISITCLGLIACEYIQWFTKKHQC